MSHAFVWHEARYLCGTKATIRVRARRVIEPEYVGKKGLCRQLSMGTGLTEHTFKLIAL